MVTQAFSLWRSEVSELLWKKRIHATPEQLGEYQWHTAWQNDWSPDCAVRDFIERGQFHTGR